MIYRCRKSQDTMSTLCCSLREYKNRKPGAGLKRLAYLSCVSRALVFNPSRTFADNNDLCLPLATGVYCDRLYVRAYNGSATVTSIMFVDNRLYGCPRPS